MLVATPRALSPAEERHLCERLTVVVPVRDDADGVAALLGSLASGADRLPVRALIVDDASADPHFEPVKAANLKAWETVFAEDVDVVERMQRGRHSPGYDGGVFSPAMDGPTHCFHRWLAKKLLAG